LQNYAKLYYTVFKSLLVRGNSWDSILDGRTVLKRRKNIGCADANWFNLAQDGDQWQNVVSTTMNPLVNFVYVFIFLSSDYTVRASLWTPLGLISGRIYP
jgi:hypothetical protein